MIALSVLFGASRNRAYLTFLLTFGDTSRPPVGAAIIEAPSMFALRLVERAGDVLPVDIADEIAERLGRLARSSRIRGGVHADYFAADTAARAVRVCLRTGSLATA